MTRRIESCCSAIWRPSPADRLADVAAQEPQRGINSKAVVGLGARFLGSGPIGAGAAELEGENGVSRYGGSSVSACEFIENPATGERITFLVSTPELLVMHAVWPRPGHRTVEHAHPAMEERFTALTGSVALRIGGRELMLAEGESATAPAGVRHLAWNPSSGSVEVRLEMRPACRWEQFTRRLFAGEDPRGLLREYGQEVSISSAG